MLVDKIMKPLPKGLFKKNRWLIGIRKIVRR